MRRDEKTGMERENEARNNFLRICSFPKYFFVSRIFLPRFVSLFVSNFCWKNILDLECVFVQPFVVISTFIKILLIIQCFHYSQYFTSRLQNRN